MGVIAGLLASAAFVAAPAGEAEHPVRAYTVPVTPQIESVRCAAGCGAHRRVMRGGTVELTGTGLGAIRKVMFLGGDGVATRVKPTSDGSLRVMVPYRAVSGPLSAWAGKGLASDPSRSLRIVPAPAPRQTGTLTRATGSSDPGAPALETAVSSGQAYAGGRGVRFSYALGGPAKVVVKLVRLSDGAVLRRWSQGEVAASKVRTLTWNVRDHSRTAADDRYAFRMSATGRGGAAASNAPVGDQTRDAFDLHRYTFPLHAPHRYAQGFGAPRAGHSHQGQDVFAPCGTPIYAARAGRVKSARYHAAAGNYVVIDGAGTGYDFMYAHLRQPSPFKTGDRVHTADRIGDVGDTGDAVGCHLHFEIWSAPGWYTGGKPFDPAALLRAWDRYS